jgi:hypothetical protein
MINKKYLIYFSVFVILVLLFEIFINKAFPEVIELHLDELKNDKEVLYQIGGYDSFEYHYNANDLKSDTLKVIITVYGKKVLKNISFVKDGADWKVYDFQLNYDDLNKTGARYRSGRNDV